MDIILRGVIIFVVVFLLMMGVYAIAMLRNRKKIGIFQTYVKEHFPHITQDTPMLVAKQKSKTARLDIALLQDDAQQQIIIVKADAGQPLTHQVYAYKDLRSVDSSNTILARGIFPKNYSYEQTLKVGFVGDVVYQFILENISNKHGTDQGADVVRNVFAPFESKLKALLGK